MDETAMLNIKNYFDKYINNTYKSYGLFAQNNQTEKTTAANITDNNGSSSSNNKQLQNSDDLNKTKQIDKPKYRISEKESIKFRQELEKYRQALA